MHDASPIWPVLVLAAIQAVDAVMCAKPLPFIADCLRDVRFPERYWRWLTPIKIAATLGLVAGLWSGPIGLATGVALVLYFAVAVTMHVRARDLGRNAFNASGLLVLSAVVTWWSFLS